MEAQELKEYFLEEAGYYKAYPDQKKQDNIMQKVNNDALKPETNYAKAIACYNHFEYLCLDDAYLFFKTDEEYFDDFKKTVREILKIIPNDFDLKRELILSGIDFRTFDAVSFKNFKARYYRKKILENIDLENADYNDPHVFDLPLKRAKEMGFDNLDYFYRIDVYKLDRLKKELHKLIQSLDVKLKSDCPHFLYGRMYLRLEDAYLKLIYTITDDQTVKNRYKILLEIKDADFYTDYLSVYNEIAFASYRFKDYKTQEYVKGLFKTKNKDDVLTYFFNNIENICSDKEDNMEYIKEIISRNVYFIPLLVYKYRLAQNVYNIYSVKKGSIEEACKMTHYFLVYVYKSFNNLEKIFFKDFYFDFEKYFDFAFNDNGLSYIMFKELTNLYMQENKKSFYIDEFKKDFLSKNKLKFNGSDFEITFKKMFDHKIIKKCANSSFYFQKGMEALVEIDLERKPTIKQLLNFNDKKMNNMNRTNILDFMKFMNEHFGTNDLEIDEEFINKFKA